MNKKNQKQANTIKESSLDAQMELPQEVVMDTVSNVQKRCTYTTLVKTGTPVAKKSKPSSMSSEMESLEESNDGNNESHNATEKNTPKTSPPGNVSTTADVIQETYK